MPGYEAYKFQVPEGAMTFASEPTSTSTSSSEKSAGPSLSTYDVYSPLYQSTSTYEAYKTVYPAYSAYSLEYRPITAQPAPPPKLMPSANPAWWFHHSSFLGGEPVAAAGEIKVVAGRLESISNNSGHYMPEPGYLIQLFLELRKRNPFFDMSAVRAEIYDGTCPSRFCPYPTSAYNAHEFVRKALTATPCNELEGSHAFAKGDKITKPPKLDTYVPSMPAGYDRTGVKRMTAQVGSAQGAEAGAGVRKNAHLGEDKASQTGGQFVKYLDEPERRRFEVRLAADGSSLEIGGGPWTALDTTYGGTPNGCSLEYPPLFRSTFIYVMSAEGKIYAASMLHVILEMNGIRLS